MARASLKTIARELGISEQTVSRALRNERYVRPELKEKIQQTAEKLGYRPDARLKALLQHMRQRSDGREGETIALILPDSTAEGIKENYYMSAIALGARARAEQAGFGFQIHTLVRRSAESLERLLQARGISLLIIAPIYYGVRRRISFHWDRYATVLIGPGIWRPNFNRVLPNYYLNMSQIMRHLKKLGYQRPGLVIERQVLLRTAGAMEAGFRQNADTILGLKRPERMVWSGKVQDYGNEVPTWLRERNVDVIISDQPRTRLFEKLGFRFPEDLGFVSTVCYAESPEISGIAIRTDILGSNAVDLISGHYLRNERGIPLSPKIVLHEGTWQPGLTLKSIKPEVSKMETKQNLGTKKRRSEDRLFPK